MNNSDATGFDIIPCPIDYPRSIGFVVRTEKLIRHFQKSQLRTGKMPVPQELLKMSISPLLEDLSFEAGV
jgi:hypothetical protein